MRKPQPQEDDFGLDDNVVRIHHIIEAEEDSLREIVEAEGLEDHIIDGEFTPEDMNDLPVHQAALLSTYAMVMILHGAVHNIMEHESLDAIEDDELKRVAMNHVPRLVQDKHNKVPQGAKDLLEKILDRK